MAGEAGGSALGRAADKLFSLSGLFAVRKPKGPTSAAVLNLLKERLLAEAGVQTKGNKRNKVLKIGHGGTLDSAATGVLVVGIGKGTKMLGTMLAGSKKYTAIGMLGKATDTLDATGKVTEEKPYDQVTKGDLENVLQKFTGDIMQVPPLYSALKKDGERLSTLMKRGKAVEAKPARPVRVYSLSLQQFQPPLFTLDVECDGGFYVRSLVNDIGKVCHWLKISQIPRSAVFLEPEGQRGTRGAGNNNQPILVLWWAAPSFTSSAGFQLPCDPVLPALPSSIFRAELLGHSSTILHPDPKHSTCEPL
ncbi:probable tRNA pseudouridine synthase 1 isoform X2 [Passer montanus]|uniref:probable tRNA pseudouridine synthase 1 isoform X2 n=1 Tax=Passer montanus TaxID=9160 RepID=UPI0019607CA5|nr:probable tRNA pseudouridine synthase 1 isoform X2 [Passer montanus]